MGRAPLLPDDHGVAGRPARSLPALAPRPPSPTPAGVPRGAQPTAQTQPRARINRPINYRALSLHVAGFSYRYRTCVTGCISGRRCLAQLDTGMALNLIARTAAAYVYM